VKCSLQRAGSHEKRRLIEMKYILTYIRRQKPSYEKAQIVENDESHLETKSR
jgi:hypothetical protein